MRFRFGQRLHHLPTAAKPGKGPCQKTRPPYSDAMSCVSAAPGCNSVERARRRSTMFEEPAAEALLVLGLVIGAHDLRAAIGLGRFLLARRPTAQPRHHAVGEVENSRYCADTSSPPRSDRRCRAPSSRSNACSSHRQDSSRGASSSPSKGALSSSPGPLPPRAQSNAKPPKAPRKPIKSPLRKLRTLAPDRH